MRAVVKDVMSTRSDFGDRKDSSFKEMAARLRD